MFKQPTTLILLISTSLASGYHLEIANDGPIVKGGTINFYVTVYKGDRPSTDKFKYQWEDNAIPQHSRQTDLQDSSDSWSVAYNASVYPIGTYRVQVEVTYCLISIVCYEIGSARIEFDITGTLNGNLTISQRNEIQEDNFVSTKDTVIHQVNLKKSDSDYISNATTVLTYWFIDCTYYGFTTDFKFPFNYTMPNEEHIIEALVMADFTPLPPSTTVPPSTTTTKPTTTTITTTTKPTTTTTTKSTVTSAPGNITVKSITTNGGTAQAINSTSLVLTTNQPDVSSTSKIGKRSIDVNIADVEKNIISKIMVKVNGSLIPSNLSFPYVCNGSQVAADSKKTYGFFYKKVIVKAPIANVNVTGNNWLQHGDLLFLQVSCGGSKTIQYCVRLMRGTYNVTGNETCDWYQQIESCQFPVKRYLTEKKYTVLIIIKNEVSKVVTPVAVTVYEVKTQAQLSVIVVPVAFSLVAVVLIVFGVAYYIQNRSRFVIEVADFNFGKQYSDMEYKTFRERLKDSIMNAFSRGPTPSSSEVPVWPPDRKYGSMT